MSVGISRYLATVKTAKHRVFQFVEVSAIPESKLIAIAVNDASLLGILSSRIHSIWSSSTGSWLGVGNDSTYVKTRCFETFPFPELDAAHSAAIGQLAEQIDAHRKRQQAQYPELTLTGMYNVLEKRRSGEVLNAKEKTLHQQGLVAVLGELHDELDRAVFAAYGWSDLAEQLVGKPGATTPLPDKPEDQAQAEEELLTRLVALNGQRAAQEAQGHIRWLRPDYQAPDAHQSAADLRPDEVQTIAVAARQGKQPWPKTMAEQVATVRGLLAKGAQTGNQLAGHFKRKPGKPLEQVLAALEVLGHAHRHGEQWHPG